MLKYKAGDKVKIRKDLKIGSVYGSCYVTQEMHDLGGAIVRIIEVNEHNGEYRIDSFGCYWTDEMFEDDVDTKEAEKPYAWLKKGVIYYSPSVNAEEPYIRHIYDADRLDKIYMKRGIVFQTKEEAIECAKKMLAVVKQEN